MKKSCWRFSFLFGISALLCLPAIAQETMQLWSVPFAPSRITLGRTGEETLQRNIEKLQKNPALNVTLHAYTLEPGSPAFRKALAEVRGEVVREHLIKVGIDGSRIDVRALPYWGERPSDSTREKSRVIFVDFSELRANNPKPRTIYFDFDSNSIRRDAAETLRQVAAVLLENPRLSVRIDGHAEERGTESYQMALTKNFAESTRDFLVALGVQAERIETFAFGKNMPVFPNAHSKAEHQRNRRVTIRFSPLAKKDPDPGPAPQPAGPS